MSEEIQEIGEDSLKYYRKHLKFGDIIENGWASECNPIRVGIVIKLKPRTIHMTDGYGIFWDLCFDKESKIKYHGNVLPLNNEYEKIRSTVYKPRSIQEP
jgi:hypothetical protein